MEGFGPSPDETRYEKAAKVIVARAKTLPRPMRPLYTSASMKRLDKAMAKVEDVKKLEEVEGLGLF